MRSQNSYSGRIVRHAEDKSQFTFRFWEKNVGNLWHSCNRKDKISVIFVITHKLCAMRKLGLLFSLLVLTTISYSQISVDQSLTLDQYVNDVLLGSGIEASNISFTGSDVQLGLLLGAEDTDFPIASGVILSSGEADNLAFDDFGGVPWGDGVSGEPDLMTIANSVPGLIGQSFSVGSVNDVCILEFDFTATGDSIKFNYSFGSDEWTTWINSSFNDIFAFFLSGPGISGPYDSPAGFPDGAINLAFIPGTDPQIPITISSVNNGNPNGSNCQYCEYYTHNTPAPAEGPFINAYTTKLTAEALVECGETYHIKMAIADGSDTALESIVVIEAGSFQSNAVVEVSLSTDVGIFYEEAIIYEDCGIATLTFERPVETILEIEEMVIISYQGVAQNGIDFTLMPDTVVFAPFVQIVEFEIDAFLDGLIEGEETVILEILNIAACGGAGLTTYFEFTIDDFPDPLVVEGYDTEMCNGDEITITPIISGGYGNFDFVWSNGDDTYETVVAPNLTTSYNLMVSDTCGIPSDDADFLVTVLQFDPLGITINPDAFDLDCGESINLIATATGGDGNYVEYYWFDEDGNNLWGWQNTLWFSTWSGANEVNVEVTDGCGLTSTATAIATLNIPALIVDQEDFIEVTCNTNYTIIPDVSGGQAPYWYNWYVNGVWMDWNTTYTVNTDEDITVTMDVSDGCGQSESVDIEIEVVSPDIVIDLEDELTGSCITVFDLDANASAGSGGFNYTWILNGVSLGSTASIDFQSDVDATIELLVSDQCGAQASDVIEILIVNPALVVELGDNIDASCIDDTEIEAEVISGSGGYLYNWIINGQEVGDQSSLEWQSFQTVNVFVEVTDGCGGYTTDQVTINIPDIPLTLDMSQDTALCIGNPAHLTALAGGGEGGFVYHWSGVDQFGQNVTVVPSSTQSFVVTATDICGESIQGNVVVDVQNIFSDFLSTYITETEIQFTATPEPPCPECTYVWDFGDGNVSDEMNPLHEFDGLSEYDVTLQVINPIGCNDLTHTLIHAPVILYIPNSFTPNNDGVNDVFQVFGDQILKYEIKIYNRWGEEVFASTDIDEVWVGNLPGGEHYVTNGVYTYVVKVKGFNSDAFEKKGTINLLR
jgi:gliding motility-associated-like protein